MKAQKLAALAGIFVLAAGCVKTVNDTKEPVLSPALALFKDKFESRYERSVGQVYRAAADAVRANGTISRENVISSGPNQVKTIEGKINKRDVWVRVEPVDPSVTSVKVQVRTRVGGTDLTLAQELQKQIAINLVAQ